MAWDAEFEAKVAALTVEQVRDAMRRHLDVYEDDVHEGRGLRGCGSAVVAPPRRKDGRTSVVRNSREGDRACRLSSWARLAG